MLHRPTSPFMYAHVLLAAALLASGCAAEPGGAYDEGVLVGEPSAPESVDPEAIRSLNDALLASYERLLHSPGTSEAELGREAEATAAARARLLAALIERSPATARTLVFAPELASELAVAFPGAAEHLEDHGSWEGGYEGIVRVDEDFSRTSTLFSLDTAAGTLRVFLTEGSAALGDGDSMRVRGVRIGDVVLGEEASVSRRLDHEEGDGEYVPTCPQTGEQRVLAVLMTFPGMQTPSVTAEQMRRSLFGEDGTSLTDYWREASYGSTWATGDVRGWYTASERMTCHEAKRIRAEAIRLVDPDVDLNDYDRLFIVVPSVGGCTWGGMGTFGCKEWHTDDGHVALSVTWLNAQSMARGHSRRVHLAQHEGGHNLGLGHSSSRRFTDPSDPSQRMSLGPLGERGALTEYGDPFDPMGNAELGHYNGQHKEMLGWMAEGAGVRTVPHGEGGTFTIAPITRDRGLRSLRVQRGEGERWLSVEYRQAEDAYERTLSDSVFDGALIHYRDERTNKRNTHLLDMTPGTSTFSDAALAVGRTWTDPFTNLSLSVERATPDGLTVRVAYAESTPCTRAHPGVALSPPNPTVLPGEGVELTVEITNRDAAGCTESTFELGSTLPEGWAGAFAEGSLVVAAGESGSTTLTVQPPADDSPGTRSVSVTASRGRFEGRGENNVTVQPSP